MPRSASRCDSSSPAGPAPTMPTWVRMPAVASLLRCAASPPAWLLVCGLERIRSDVCAHRDPAGVGERVQVGRAAEAGAGARGEDAAERGVRRVVHGLVVD